MHSSIYYLVISETAEEVLRDEIGKYFELKPKSIDPPKIYLGRYVHNVALKSGTKARAFSSSQYAQSAVKNVEEYLEKQDR